MVCKSSTQVLRSPRRRARDRMVKGRRRRFRRMRALVWSNNMNLIVSPHRPMDGNKSTHVLRSSRRRARDRKVKGRRRRFRRRLTQATSLGNGQVASLRVQRQRKLDLGLPGLPRSPNAYVGVQNVW